MINHQFPEGCHDTISQHAGHPVVSLHEAVLDCHLAIRVTAFGVESSQVARSGGVKSEVSDGTMHA